MESASKCAPCAGETLVFACSGAADVGAIADQAARKLTKDGVGKMFCLAGVGGKVPDILDKTRAATRRIAIDGCEKDCAKLCLQQAGLEPTLHLRLTELGMEKGKTPVSYEAIEWVTGEVTRRLA